MNKKQSVPRLETPQQREGSRPSKRSSALVERACRRIALTELILRYVRDSSPKTQNKQDMDFEQVSKGLAHAEARGTRCRICRAIRAFTSAICKDTKVCVCCMRGEVLTLEDGSRVRFCYGHRRVEPVAMFRGKQRRCMAALQKVQAKRRKAMEARRKLQRGKEEDGGEGFLAGLVGLVGEGDPPRREPPSGMLIGFEEDRSSESAFIVHDVGGGHGGGGGQGRNGGRVVGTSQESANILTLLCKAPPPELTTSLVRELLCQEINEIHQGLFSRRDATIRGLGHGGEGEMGVAQPTLVRAIEWITAPAANQTRASGVDKPKPLWRRHGTRVTPQHHRHPCANDTHMAHSRTVAAVSTVVDMTRDVCVGGAAWELHPALTGWDRDLIHHEIESSNRT
jgi:hypothetical protein